MYLEPAFDSSWLQQLLRAPGKCLRGQLGGIEYEARIVIPGIRENITRHYAAFIRGNLEQLCAEIEVPLPPADYGVEITFSEPAELKLHNENLVIHPGLRDIMAKNGPVIIRNACLDEAQRNLGHRNKFPHLNFHLDRTSKQHTVFSMYTRNPFDSEQRYPRPSSTLFTPQLTAYLQAVKESQLHIGEEKGIRGTYQIFEKENMPELFNSIILEHRWDLPEGQGEISKLDNRTCLHSSFYREANRESYKIGVRYLAPQEEVLEDYRAYRTQ